MISPSVGGDGEVAPGPGKCESWARDRAPLLAVGIMRKWQIGGARHPLAAYSEWV